MYLSLFSVNVCEIFKIAFVYRKHQLLLNKISFLIEFIQTTKRATLAQSTMKWTPRKKYWNNVFFRSCIPLNLQVFGPKVRKCGTKINNNLYPF